MEAKPFVKWVGGKRSILDELSVRMPSGKYDKYFEPFIGGGSVFFKFKPINAYISDLNRDLITTYIQIRDNCAELIQHLSEHSKNNSKEYFYHIRNKFNSEIVNDVEIASMFIYLNKTCFNGLYRVNKKGFYNVPFGSYVNPNICDSDNLLLCSEQLQNVDIKCQSFEDIEIVENSFYYFDSPYHLTFTQYNQFGFSEDHQLVLRDICRQVHDAGSKFMASNSDTEFIREIYKEFYIEEINSNRSVSCDSDKRGKTQELIIRNY